MIYADDTLICAIGDTDEECRNKINCDINILNNWLKMNKLKLNENKTKIMEINILNDINFEINGKIIEKLSNIKYLGFIIDKKLKFNDHSDYNCKKIAKKVGYQDL